MIRISEIKPPVKIIGISSKEEAEKILDYFKVTLSDNIYNDNKSLIERLSIYTGLTAYVPPHDNTTNKIKTIISYKEIDWEDGALKKEITIDMIKPGMKLKLRDDLNEMQKYGFDDDSLTFFSGMKTENSIITFAYNYTPRPSQFYVKENSHMYTLAMVDYIIEDPKHERKKDKMKQKQLLNDKENKDALINFLKEKEA